VTVAEKTPDAADYPGSLPKMLRAGSLVFTQPKSVAGPDITAMVVVQIRRRLAASLWRP
jgi:hypothetical protein